MRNLITVCVWAAVAAGLAACSVNGGAQPGRGPGLEVGAVRAGAVMLRSEGRDVLRLSLPEGANCSAQEGAARVESRGHEVVTLWMVEHASTVDEGVGRVTREIEAEFKDFRPLKSMEVSVGGSPARRVTGSGTEADDGDPGSADVVVFKVGPGVFIACAHGESLTSAARSWLMTVVQGATGPER